LSLARIANRLGEANRSLFFLGNCQIKRPDPFLFLIFRTI
jgi:hypothetical protein